MFWLGVLVTVGFTAWRLLANLKALLRSVTELNERLAPTLEDLAAKAQETAELGERLQRRQGAARQGAARQGTTRQRTARPALGRRRASR